MLCFTTHFPDILLWGLIGICLLWVGFNFVLWVLMFVVVLFQYYLALFVYIARGKTKEFFSRSKTEPDFLDYNKEKKKFNWW